MLLSRRQFNRGAAALSGAAAMPPVPLSLRGGSDDAYGAMLSELARVEEAAHAAGGSFPGSGAVTATGQKLEAFLGHLDMQVKPLESAGQVYRELRSFLKEKAKETAQQLREEVTRASGKGVAGDVPPLESGAPEDTADQPGTAPE